MPVDETNKRKKTVKRLIKAVLFLLVFILVISAVSRIVVNPEDYRHYQWIRGFYSEPKNSLDVVFIGSSVNYSEINPMFLWNAAGIASRDFTTNSQPLEVVEYLLREAVRRQPEALYVISLNTIQGKLSDVDLHYVTDYMPFSFNKLHMIDRYLELQKSLGQAKGEEGTGLKAKRWQYVFPVILYHTRWEELESIDFLYKNDGVKGACYYSTYLSGITDISEDWQTNDEREPLSDLTEETLSRLLQVIEEENVRVLFTIYPRAEANQKMYSQYNTLVDRLTEQGYDIFDMRDCVDESGINLVWDYYNMKHTNIHGAVKYTQAMADYLTEHYDFTDRRGTKAYRSFDRGLEKYLDAVGPYFIEFELDQAHYDERISVPELLDLEFEDGNAVLNWTPVFEADGYLSYRKEIDPDGEKKDFVGRFLGLKYDISSWEQIADLPGKRMRTFTDETVNLKKGHTYIYTVVPYRDEGAERFYGTYDYDGISKKKE